MTNPHASHIREAAEAYANALAKESGRDPGGAVCVAAYRGFLAGAKAALESPVVKAMAEALESNASKHKPRHDQKEYWLGISHDTCAETLANDTRIAREALAAYESARKGEG